MLRLQRMRTSNAPETAALFLSIAPSIGHIFWILHQQAVGLEGLALEICGANNVGWAECGRRYLFTTHTNE